MHQALTVQVIEERLNEECPQLSIEEHLPAPEQPHQPMPKKLTRTQVIKQILQQQQEVTPPPQQHELEETAGYLRCVRCGTNVHKRSNEQVFQAFVQGQCLDQPYTSAHAGHTSHGLWQKGSKVTCTQCGVTLHLDGQQRLILTAAVKKPCKGSGSSGSPPLTEIFRKQMEQASQHSSPDSAGDTSHMATQEPQALHEQVKKPRLDNRQPAQPSTEDHHRPTPRRLHFPTGLDLQEQGSKADAAALAMIPSQVAAKAPTRGSGHTADTSQRANASMVETASQPSDDNEHEQDDQPLNVDYYF